MERYVKLRICETEIGRNWSYLNIKVPIVYPGGMLYYY